jgi:hypothetical protein
VPKERPRGPDVNLPPGGLFTAGGPPIEPPNEAIFERHRHVSFVVVSRLGRFTAARSAQAGLCWPENMKSKTKTKNR